MSTGLYDLNSKLLCFFHQHVSHLNTPAVGYGCIGKSDRVLCLCFALGGFLRLRSTFTALPTTAKYHSPRHDSCHHYRYDSFFHNYYLPFIVFELLPFRSISLCLLITYHISFRLSTIYFHLFLFIFDVFRFYPGFLSHYVQFISAFSGFRAVFLFIFLFSFLFVFLFFFLF